MKGSLRHDSCPKVTDTNLHLYLFYLSPTPRPGHRVVQNRNWWGEEVMTKGKKSVIAPPLPHGKILRWSRSEWNDWERSFKFE